jgi:hypothetical protein
MEMSMIKTLHWGIRYAVDNGAKVINGSFFNRQQVYDALKYAEKKMYCLYMLQEMTQKILILLNFPNDSEDKVKEFADNVITSIKF